MAQKQLDIQIKATDAASAVFKRVGDNAKKELSNLQQVKSIFGEEGSFGQLAKVAAGTGAVAGLSLAGRLLGDAATKAVELRDQLNAGKIHSGEMAEQLARSIPIFGSLIGAGRDIRELFTGEQAAAERIRREGEFGVEYAKQRLDIQKVTLDSHKQLLEIIRQINRETALRHAGPGEQERLTIGFSAEDQAAKIKEAADKAEQDVRTRFAKLRADTQAQLSQTTKTIETGTAPVGVGLLVAATDKGMSAQEASLKQHLAALAKDEAAAVGKIAADAASAASESAWAAADADLQARFKQMGERLRAFAQQQKDEAEKQAKEAKAAQDRTLAFSQARVGVFAAQRSILGALSGPLGTLSSLIFGDPSKRRAVEPAFAAAEQDTFGSGFLARQQNDLEIQAANQVTEQQKTNQLLDVATKGIATLTDKVVNLLDKVQRNTSTNAAGQTTFNGSIFGWGDN